MSYESTEMRLTLELGSTAFGEQNKRICNRIELSQEDKRSDNGYNRITNRKNSGKAQAYRNAGGGVKYLSWLTYTRLPELPFDIGSGLGPFDLQTSQRTRPFHNSRKDFGLRAIDGA